MVDLPKLVNELSNLTVLEAAKLATMLREKWDADEKGQPGTVRAAQKQTEGADIRLMQQLIFQPSGVCVAAVHEGGNGEGENARFQADEGVRVGWLL